MSPRRRPTRALLLLLIGLALLTVNLAAAPGRAQLQPQAPEEFVGPFPSWRQVQCTGADDTALLQNELDTLGRSGSPVLYIRPGVCRITSTLRLGQGAGATGGVENVSLLGHDPSDTTILWAGSPGGKMFEVDGVAHSRFGRLTWDGGGLADIGYFDQTHSGENYFPTGVRHEDEVFRNISGVALYLGAGTAGTSEWEYMRMQFLGPMQAGIYLANANTLDHWVWDSLFQNVAWGITNYVPERGLHGAGGDFAVNRSNFLNGGTDIGFGNVQPFGSSRWNYSKGSQHHLNGVGVGKVNASWTSLGETMLDPTSDSMASEADNGPVGFLGGTFRGGKSKGMLGVHEGYCETSCLGDLWALGNTFSNAAPEQYAIPYPQCCGRIHAGLDDKNGQAIVDPGPINLPPTPPVSTLPIIEVQNGDIAAALAQAGDRAVVVHIPYGKWDVPATLEVGPNVTLTGDGFGATRLAAGPNVSPILHLAGPSHAVVRDLALRGWTRTGRPTDGLLIDNADQPGGLVHSEFALLQANKAAWDIAGLAHTTVDLVDDYNGGNTHCGNDGTGPDVDYKVTGAKLRIYNGAGAGTDAMFQLSDADVVDETHYFEGNPGCQPAQLIAPNGSGSLVINEGNFAPSTGGIDSSSFNGLFTMANFANTLAGDSNAVTARSFGPNSLVLGLAYGGHTDNLTPTCAAPCLIWLPQHVQPNLATPEQNNGVADVDQFMREHLAPLLSARPLPTDGRASDVTQVRLYRVGGELLSSGIRVVGGRVPTTPAPPPAARSAGSIAEPTPAMAPALAPAAGSSWVVPRASSVSASNTWSGGGPASGAFACNPPQAWNGADVEATLTAVFPDPVTFSGIRLLVSATPASTIGYSIYGSNDGNRWDKLADLNASVTPGWTHLEGTFSQVTYSQLLLRITSSESWVTLDSVAVLAAPDASDACAAA